MTSPRERGKAARAALTTPAGCAVLLALGFIAITVWWALTDDAAPAGDPSRHLNLAFEYPRRFFQGDTFYWLTGKIQTGPADQPNAGPIYPPLVHLVGATGTALGGLSVDGPVIALNAVFVSLLVAGCYGVARVALGAWAGVLMVVFVLASPMTISQFHLFMIDLPLAACVAAAAWALFASDGFSDRRLSIVTGVLFGVGLMTKQTFPLFVAPVVLVVLLRGGWWNPANFGIACGIAFVMAFPWYVTHVDDLRRVTREATAQGPVNPYGTAYTRWGVDNFSWYAWNHLNNQFFLPLTLFYAIGIVAGAVSWVRSRVPRYFPELLVGSLTGNLGTAVLFGFQDPRYSFPSVVFIAAVAVGWIFTAARPVRIAATAALLTVLALNTVTVNLGVGGDQVIKLSGSGQGADVRGYVRVASRAGYTVGKPDDGGRALELLRAAKRDGLTGFGYEFRSKTFEHLNPAGLAVFARIADIDTFGADDPRVRSPKSMFFAVRQVRRGYPKPCQRFSDGWGLYVYRDVRGSTKMIDLSEQKHPYCPI